MVLNTDVNSLVINDTGPPTTQPLPPEPTWEAPPNQPDACENCKRPFQDDIVCARIGAVNELWLCDDCFTAQRGKGLAIEVAQALYKKFMDQGAVTQQLDVVRQAIENCAEIKWVQANDAAGSERSVNLNLTFRESRSVFRALYQVLRKKQSQNESFPT